MKMIVVLLSVCLLLSCSSDRDAREALNSALLANQQNHHEVAYNGFLRVVREYPETEAATEAHRYLASLSYDLEELVSASIDLYRLEKGKLPPDLNALFSGYLKDQYLFVIDILSYQVNGDYYRVKAKWRT